MKINPYKIGLSFYTILVLGVIGLLSYKTQHNQQYEIQLQKEVEESLNLIDLSKYK
jgi:hypothetical protein